MQNIVIEVINNYGYVGIALLIALESIFPPIPSEIILGFGGFLTTISDMSIIGVIISSTIGSYIGAVTLYLFGYCLNEEKLISIIDSRIGKTLHLSKKNFIKSIKWFKEKGLKTIFICRLVPVIRSLISIPAGIAHTNFKLFSLYTLAGSFIWNTILTFAGSYLGKSWSAILTIIKDYSVLVLITIVLFTLILFIKKIKKN